MSTIRSPVPRSISVISTSPVARCSSAARGRSRAGIAHRDPPRVSAPRDLARCWRQPETSSARRKRIDSLFAQRLGCIGEAAMNLFAREARVLIEQFLFAPTVGQPTTDLLRPDPARGRTSCRTRTCDQSGSGVTRTLSCSMTVKCSCQSSRAESVVMTSVVVSSTLTSRAESHRPRAARGRPDPRIPCRR